MPINKNAVAVYMLVQTGWWATWVPGQSVIVHADDEIPTDLDDLLNLADWDAYGIPEGSDGNDVREVLEDLGHAVESWEWSDLPE